MVVLGSLLAAVPGSSVGAIPAAGGPGVVWSASLSGPERYCDTTYNFISNWGGGNNTVETRTATRPCSTHLSDTGFSYGGQDWNVWRVSYEARPDWNTAPNHVQVWLDAKLTAGQQGTGGFPADVHAERWDSEELGWNARVNSRLFFWLGATPLPVRDAGREYQMPVEAGVGADSRPAVPAIETLHWPDAPVNAPNASGGFDVRLAIAPPEPTGVTSAARNGGLAISWDAAGDAASGPATGYDVGYKTAAAPNRAATTAGDPSTGWVNHPHSDAATSTTISGLTNGTAYEVRVRAKNANGWSLWTQPHVWQSEFTARMLASQQVGCRADAGTPYGEFGNFCDPLRHKSWPNGWEYRGNDVTVCGCDWMRNQWSPVRGALTDNDFTWKGTEYKMVSLYEDGQLNIHVEGLGASEAIPDSDLSGLRLRFEREGGSLHEVTLGINASAGYGNTSYRFAGEWFSVANEYWDFDQFDVLWTALRVGERARVWLWDAAGSTPKASAPAVGSGSPSTLDRELGRFDPDGRPGAGSPQAETEQAPSAQDDPPPTLQDTYAELIAQMRGWRDDPKWRAYKSHTDRWDRALLAFGVEVPDKTLTAMTAAQAQALADTAWGQRWVPVAAALWEIESAPPPQPDAGDPPDAQDPPDVQDPPDSGSDAGGVVARYDTDGDGQIDNAEWAAARAAFIRGDIDYSELSELLAARTYN